MSTLYLGHFVQFFDDNGDPLSGGTVKFYEPGTSTPKDVYSDSGLGTPLGSEVTLDSAGRATIFLNGDYKARLEDSDGVLVDESDNINPPLETETSGGNLIANGSFETQGNASTDASGWTLTPQSDGTVERVTTDNYDGEACLKFVSDGSGGGQADTNSFFPVSPGRSYEVSFALKCSVADIRNIVQVRYFDKDQSFISSTSVYDEDSSNPTSWTVKSFVDNPPSNARFAKLRVLGADQSDTTPGEAKFDSLHTSQGSGFFPNVDSDVTATDEELNKLDGFTGSTADLNEWDGLSSNGGYESTLIDIRGDGDFDSTSTNKVRIVRIGNMVWAAFIGEASHSSTSDPVTSLQTIPSHLSPNEFVINTFSIANNMFSSMFIEPLGNVGVVYRDSSLQSTLASSSNDPPIVFWTLD